MAFCIRVIVPCEHIEIWESVGFSREARIDSFHYQRNGSGMDSKVKLQITITRIDRLEKVSCVKRLPCGPFSDEYRESKTSLTTRDWHILVEAAGTCRAEFGSTDELHFCYHICGSSTGPTFKVGSRPLALGHQCRHHRQREGLKTTNQS